MSDSVSVHLPGEDAYIATINLLIALLEGMPIDVRQEWARLLLEDYKAARGLFKLRVP